MGVRPIYAIVESGGKQYKVEVGKTIDVDRMEAEEGSTLLLEQVLLVADGDQMIVGRPTVPGAKVVADVLGEVRGDKLIVFKFKPKVRYRRKLGHRQRYTRLVIKEIMVGSEVN